MQKAGDDICVWAEAPQVLAAVAPRDLSSWVRCGRFVSAQGETFALPSAKRPSGSPHSTQEISGRATRWVSVSTQGPVSHLESQSWPLETRPGVFAAFDGR